MQNTNQEIFQEEKMSQKQEQKNNKHEVILHIGLILLIASASGLVVWPIIVDSIKSSIDKSYEQKKAQEDFQKNLEALTWSDAQKAQAEKDKTAKAFNAAFEAFKKTWSNPKSELSDLKMTIRKLELQRKNHTYKNRYKYDGSSQQIVVRNLVKAREGLPSELAKNIKKAIAEAEAEIAQKEAEAKESAEMHAKELADLEKARKKIVMKQAEANKVFSQLQKTWSDQKTNMETLKKQLQNFDDDYSDFWDDDIKLPWLEQQQTRKDLSKTLKKLIQDIIDENTDEWADDDSEEW